MRTFVQRWLVVCMVVLLAACAASVDNPRHRDAGDPQLREILPSQPQSFVGPTVESWARQPLAQWLRTTAP